MRARELFASALETPGGLKVQTIHALCTRLLQQFPFEANVPARFAVLDDRDQNAMMERANLAVLLEASRDPDSAAGARCRSRWPVRPTSPSRTSCARPASAAITSWPGPTAPAPPMQRRQVSAALGVDPGDYIEDVEHEIIDGPHLPRSRGKKSPPFLAPAARPTRTRRGGCAKRWCHPASSR